MIDLTTTAVMVGSANIGSAVVGFFLRRAIDRMDKAAEKLAGENSALIQRVDILEEKRVASLERDIKAEGEKRKAIYEHLVEIRMEAQSKHDCRENHATLAGQFESYMAAVLKLERVCTEVTRLVVWVDEVSKEQIGAGKDIAALVAKTQILYDRKEKQS